MKLDEAARPRLALATAAAVFVGVAVVAAVANRGQLGGGAAIVLGVVEGLTEFLPVSSTGHLTVVERLLDLHTAAADSYTIVIQAGAILAVLVLYRRRLVTMLNGLRGRDPAGRRLVVAVMVGFVPAAVVGFAFGDTIKERLFGVGPVAIAWAVGAVLLLVVSRKFERRGGAALESLTGRHALLIGGAQVLALWPGVSRSLVTIVAGVMLGLSVTAAVEFSFLLGLVTLGAATSYEALRQGPEIVRVYGLWAPTIGFVVAFVAAVASVRWMVSYLEHHTLALFGRYRLAAAALAAILLLTGAV